MRIEAPGSGLCLLDISHKLATLFRRSNCPYGDERCLAFGIDITRSPIPAWYRRFHYTCGGVMVEPLTGRTDLNARSYAIWRNQLHRPARPPTGMASNSGCFDVSCYGPLGEFQGTFCSNSTTTHIGRSICPRGETKVRSRLGRGMWIILAKLGRVYRRFYCGDYVRGSFHQQATTACQTPGGYAASGNPRVLQQLHGYRDLP